MSGDAFTRQDVEAAAATLAQENMRAEDGYYWIGADPARLAKVREWLESVELENALAAMPASLEILGWERWRYEERRRETGRSPNGPTCASVLAWLASRP